MKRLLRLLLGLIMSSLLTFVIGCNPSYYYNTYWNVPVAEQYIDLQDRFDYQYPYTYHLYSYRYPYPDFPLSLLRYYSYDRYYWGPFDSRRYEGWWHK